MCVVHAHLRTRSWHWLSFFFFLSHSAFFGVEGMSLSLSLELVVLSKLIGELLGPLVSDS